VSPDGQTLYVTNAGDDDVAVVRLATGTTPDRVTGLIPTAWYPSGVAVDPTGTTLFATNMKGLGAGPHLDPTTYWPAFMGGTLSRIPVPNATQLAAYTAQVAANDRFGVTPTIPAGSVIPAHPGDPTPITHVIYVMKENRTYDQILGDLGRGNGDPSLSIFGGERHPEPARARAPVRHVRQLLRRRRGLRRRLELDDRRLRERIHPAGLAGRLQRIRTSLRLRGVRGGDDGRPSG
jgi:YVTN family beta-propeller protein